MDVPTYTQFDILLKIFAFCTLILWIKYIGSLLYGINVSNHPEEDRIMHNKGVPPDIRRRERQFANDLETIPLHVTIFWAALFIQTLANCSGHGAKETIALSYLYAIYVACRVFYTLCYLCKWQPMRTLFFYAALLCVAATVLLMALSSLKIDTYYAFPQMRRYVVV